MTRIETADPRHPQVRGFSLVELMIAITLLGVGLLSLAGLFPVAMQRVSVGDLESRATFHAQAKIEELKALPWNNLTASAAADTVETVFQRGWVVLEDTPANGMKQVQVIVSWADNKGPRNVTISSYLSDSGI
jgi:prepilin-type N-terminal cleavage/methylation domain-containing protein